MLQKYGNYIWAGLIVVALLVVDSGVSFYIGHSNGVAKCELAQETANTTLLQKHSQQESARAKSGQALSESTAQALERISNEKRQNSINLEELAKASSTGGCDLSPDELLFYTSKVQGTKPPVQ